jgi:2-octaprenyl-6-methoxyphenol hydroxylase
MKNHFKIAICGAGPVGQSLALHIVGAQFPADEIALIDAKTIEQAEQDVRTIALSYGSQQILNQLGGWPVHSQAIQEIHVSRRAHFGRTLIRAKDYDVPALGYVARYSDICTPLQTQVTAKNIYSLRPVKVVQLQHLAHYVQLDLEDGRTITADYVVQAEGGIFSDQSQRQHYRDYQQTAIIAHVKASKAQMTRAFERFTEQGPLALLPHEDGYALVWCVKPELAQELLRHSDADFLRALQQAFGQRVGQFISCGPRFSFALGLNANTFENQTSALRSVKIGNAAQTLHPVAGQGLNLGLRDAHTLGQCLLRYPLEQVSGQYDEKRKLDQQTTVHLTDTMARVFASSADGSLMQSILGASLAVLDVLPHAKGMLAKQMMFGRR